MTKPSKTSPYTTTDGEVPEDRIDADFFQKAKRGRPALPPHQRKTRVTIMLDPDLIEAAKKDGERGWQTRLNQAARKGMGI
ncbi:MAG: BrnA antitoxin family protein [Pseudomonadota bacterium]